MRASLKDFPLDVTIPEGTMGQAAWGDMVVEVGRFKKTVDVAPLLKGLPDDRCQCPHWGHVLKGRLRYRYADREEVYSAGDVYYAAPGHTPVLEAGLEYVEFSPAKPLAKTMKVVERNMASASSK
jgi:hypothetical protein